MISFNHVTPDFLPSTICRRKRAVLGMTDLVNAASFSSFSHLLDARILRALADIGFARPTPVQLKTIPNALENKDILARARTGTGKTAAYCIPVVQKILSAKDVCTFGVNGKIVLNDMNDFMGRHCQKWTQHTVPYVP